jgi:medium-chain acyl-[acyl-carrier-protein] hydrolase
MTDIDGKTTASYAKKVISSDRVWKEDHRIRTYETDPHGGLSVVSVFNYLQEAAENNAHALGVSVRQVIQQHQHYTWVISRMSLKMDAYPGWGDPIRVCTWPSGVRGPFSLRDFLVIGTDDQPIGAAVSAWLLIDAKTRSPLRRVQSVLDKLKAADIEHPLENGLAKLPTSTGYDHEESFLVRYSDLDLNWHVNNVNYINWIVRSLPIRVFEIAVLRSLEVNYIAEAFAGDEVLSKYRKVDEQPLSFLHYLFRKNDGRELLRARTVWNKR